MSVQAMAWALEQAEDVPPHLVALLIGLANHAKPDGTAAYPGTARLARYTRKSERQTVRDLQELLDLGLIQLGDERHVAHIRADRRPTVYDLVTDVRGDVGTSWDERGDAHDMSSYSARPDVDDMSPTTRRRPRGDIQGRHGVTPMSPEPSTEPTTTNSSKSVKLALGNAREPAEREPLPFDFEPNLEHAAIATHYGLDVIEERDAFTDHALSEGRTSADWDAAFRNWLRVSWRRNRERADRTTISATRKALDWLECGTDPPAEKPRLRAITGGAL